MNKTESEIIADTLKRIKKRDSFLQKKFPFGCRITYFDADDLSILIKNDFIPIKTKSGETIKIAGSGYKDDECLVLKPEDIVDLTFANQETIDAVMLLRREFGKIKFNGLTAPGLEQMRYYCLGLTDFLASIAIELKKKHKIERIFEKLLELMEKPKDGKNDYLYQRILHYKTVCELYFSDRDGWMSDMRRLKLI